MAVSDNSWRSMSRSAAGGAKGVTVAATYVLAHMTAQGVGWIKRSSPDSIAFRL